MQLHLEHVRARRRPPMGFSTSVPTTPTSSTPTPTPPASRTPRSCGSAARSGSWWDEPGGRGFWAVTRHADLLHVSRNVDVFSSAQGVTLEEMDPGRLRRPPQHARVRPARAHALPPSRLQAVQPSRGVRLRRGDPVAGTCRARRSTAARSTRAVRLRRIGRQATADADARPAAGRARLRRSVAGRARRRAARQLRPRLHRPSGRSQSTPTSSRRSRSVPRPRSICTATPSSKPRPDARTRPTT